MKILITGGSGGLGASIVKRLASDSQNTIYFTYVQSVSNAKKIEALYPNTEAICCDFRSQTTINNLIERIPGLDIDALVNNANGSIHKEHFYKTNPDVFLNSFELNIMPTLKITREAINVFRKKKFGKIINIISSAVINKPPIGWSEYVANKAYLLAMSNAWATECIRFNITSNCISPSFMETNLNKDLDERVIEQIKENHPLKRILTTEEVAEVVSFLVKAPQHINGTNTVINAGMDIH